MKCKVNNEGTRAENPARLPAMNRKDDRAMCNISKEEQKTEAIRRMEKIGIYKPTIQQFDKEDKISRSEPPFGAFYWIEDEDMKIVRKFEKEYDAVVFLGIRTYTEDGVMDNYLFISNHPEEWEDDRQELDEGEAVAYIYNRDAPYYSEMGWIGFTRTIAAGLRRIW